MNLKKTLSSAALLLATTALLAASSFALPVAINTPTSSVKVGGTAITPAGSAIVGLIVPTTTSVPAIITVNPVGNPADQICTYTTDGSTPTATTGTPCSTPYSILPNSNGTANTVTIKAIASPTAAETASYKPSLVYSAKYIIETQVTAPTISPNGAPSLVKVAFSDAWTGLSSTGAVAKPSFHYTTDGTDPSSTVGTLYIPGVTNLSMGATAQTLKVVAYALGYATSPVVSAKFGPASTGAVSYFVGAGSSAQFNEFAFAAAGPLGKGDGNAQCGARHFTKKNAAQIADVRSALTPAETGHLFLVWDDDVTPTKICAYVSLDSTVGVKAFMVSNLATPASYINITGTSTPDNMMNPFWDKANPATADVTSIPSAVLTAIQGQTVNAGITDIRPEDAKFATTRALTTLNAARTGLGYGPGPIGSPIVSVAGTKFNVVDFAITGADPISRAAQQAYTTISVGAAPVVVFVNTFAPTADGAFHFSDSSITNIGRFTLAGYLNGSITRTSALATSPATGAPVHVWLREPLSGTYNTMEWNIPASKEIASSQEIGVVPAVCTTAVSASCTGADANGNTGNPLNITVSTANLITTNALGTVDSTGKMIGLVGATRQRAIGTGEMVKQVAKTTGCTITEGPGGATSVAGTCVGSDAIGYAFWGYGNFSFGNNNAPYTTKYIQVDGVDPIKASYTDGTFPVCDSNTYPAAPCTIIPFTHVVDGSYPIWSLYRVVTKATVPTMVANLVAAAQANANIVYDFVPASQLGVFRSHYAQAGVAAANGHKTGVSEAGGDMGGAVYTVQQDNDHVTDFGTEILSVKQ